MLKSALTSLLSNSVHKNQCSLNLKHRFFCVSIIIVLLIPALIWEQQASSPSIPLRRFVVLFLHKPVSFLRIRRTCLCEIVGVYRPSLLSTFRFPPSRIVRNGLKNSINNSERSPCLLVGRKSPAVNTGTPQLVPIVTAVVHTALGLRFSASITQRECCCVFCNWSRRTGQQHLASKMGEFPHPAPREQNRNVRKYVHGLPAILCHNEWTVGKVELQLRVQLFQTVCW